MKWVFFCVSAFLLFVIIVFYDNETVDTYFEDYEHASRNGVIPVDAWMPQFLPRSAHSIYEQHNIDTNELWVTFIFAENELATMVSTCDLIKKDHLRLPRVDRTLDIEWWWGRDFDPLRREGLQYFNCGSNSFLLIDITKSKAFFWKLAS